MVKSIDNTDIKLLKEVAKGNMISFNELYLLYKDRVYNTAIGYVQNVDEAEELTQDVFVTIFNSAYLFKEKSKVSTWIYRITINKSLNRLKKITRVRNYNVEINDYHRIDFQHPGVIIENKEKSQYLFAAIKSLAEKQKTAFILSYVEGLPRQEVADIMDTTLKAIESLLQRAKHNLRKILISDYFVENIK